MSARANTASQQTPIVFAVLFALGMIAPFVVYPTFLMKILCFGLFACAFNLLLGFAGLLSFGHAAFLGSAGYVCGLLMTDYGTTPEIGILAGTVTAGLLGWLFGVLAIRRSGIYFAMITLALAQMVFFLCLQLPFTGGEDGLQGVPRGRLFGLVDLSDNIAMYYPVSYTHLDVYKRQEQGVLRFGFLVEGTDNDAFFQRQGDKRAELVALGPALQGGQACRRAGAPGVLDAVSYTHLDVYKRQTGCRSTAKCANPPWRIPRGRSKALPVLARRSAGGACGDCSASASEPPKCSLPSTLWPTIARWLSSTTAAI